MKLTRLFHSAPCAPYSLGGGLLPPPTSREAEVGLPLVNGLDKHARINEGVQLGRSPLGGLTEHLADVGGGVQDTLLHPLGDGLASLSRGLLLGGGLPHSMRTLLEGLSEGGQLLVDLGGELAIVDGKTDSGQVGVVGSHSRQPLSRGRTRPKFLFSVGTSSLTFCIYYNSDFEVCQGVFLFFFGNSYYLLLLRRAPREVPWPCLPLTIISIPQGNPKVNTKIEKIKKKIIMSTGRPGKNLPKR